MRGERVGVVDAPRRTPPAASAIAEIPAQRRSPIGTPGFAGFTAYNFDVFGVKSPRREDHAPEELGFVDGG